MSYPLNKKERLERARLVLGGSNSPLDDDYTCMECGSRGFITLPLVLDPLIGVYSCSTKIVTCPWCKEVWKVNSPFTSML